MTQGRFWPMRWQRSADCHSAAGFHHLVWGGLVMNKLGEMGGRVLLGTGLLGGDLRVDDEDSRGFC